MSDDRIRITQEDLKQFRQLQRRIDILREIKAKYQSEIDYNVRQRTTMHDNGRKRESRIRLRMESLEEVQRILDGFMDESARRSADILSFIDELQDPASCILYSRFVLGLSWQAVASKVHLSSDRCKHIASDVFKRT